MTQTEIDPEATPADESRRNERSAIGFPYSSLEDAEAVARAVHDWGGNEVSLDRIATTLNTTVKSSGFRTAIASARTFGFDIQRLTWLSCVPGRQP